MGGQTQQQERKALDYQPFDWTPERVETLRTMWNNGDSASQIVAALGGGLTRSAVIGKAHRLHLVSHAKAPNTRLAGVKAKPVVGKKGRAGMSAQLAKNARSARLKELPQMASSDASGMKLLKSAAWAALPGSSPVPLVDLERGQCRWPIGDAPMLFCGLASDGVYCAIHGRLSRSAAK